MAIELEITALPWLEKMLSITTFFSVCNVHQYIRNKYCLDCNERPLCHSCIQTPEHKNHRVIQIRRSSCNVVRATEIQDHVNIDGIQRYMINSSKVIYLKKRFHDQENVNIKNCRFTCNCRACNKNLADCNDFCSLECKLEWVKVNGTFVTRASKHERKGMKLEEEEETKTSSSSSDEKNEELPERTLKRKAKEENKDQEEESVISRPVSYRRPNSRRKGIPHRAPFF